jgi:ferric-dicitrate binding protein FerR (iron transport regulator)
LTTRSKFTLSIVVLAAILGWSSQHAAFAADPDRWTVSAASGDAKALYNGAGWSRIKAGTKLYPGTLIETGKDGRVVITRPGDSVAVSANSRMEIPVRTGNGGFAHIRQLLGTALFKITTRPENPFNVETPYLAAVIKGTTFTVSVSSPPLRRPPATTAPPRAARRREPPRNPPAPVS